LIIFRRYTPEIHPLDIYFELVAGGKLGDFVLVNGYMFYGVKLYVLNYSLRSLLFMSYNNMMATSSMTSY
jgi:hypothetical protein